MYKVKTKAETGYLVSDSKDVGGSIIVEYQFKEYDNDLLNFCKSLTDSLDHCLITNLDNSLQYSKRFILIENSKKTFLIDVCDVLSSLSEHFSFVTEFNTFNQLLESMTVSLNNESYTVCAQSFENKIMIKRYNIEG